LEWDYLKNCKKALRERIKIAPGSEKCTITAFSGRELSAEHLSAEECKDAEEEEEEDKEGDDSLNTVDQRGKEVLQ
jgi:hypothetical protein